MLSTSTINTLIKSKDNHLEEAKTIVTKLLKNDPTFLFYASKIIKGIYDNESKVFTSLFEPSYIDNLNIILNVPIESKDISKTKTILQTEALVQEMIISPLSQIISSYLRNELGAWLCTENGTGQRLFYLEEFKAIHESEEYIGFQDLSTSIERLSHVRMVGQQRLVIKLPKETIKEICESLEKTE